MGVGGGFVAREPGGERILAWQGQPLLLGSPCRPPGSGWIPSLASAGVLGCFSLVLPSSDRPAFASLLGSAAAGANGTRTAFAPNHRRSAFGSFLGIHDNKLLQPDP